MQVLLIDDLREIPGVTYVARTFDDGIAALRDDGPWDLLLLDHDLGEEDPRHTGYNVLCWLEELAEYLPRRIELVTANPVGRGKMEVVIERMYEMQSRD